VLLSTSIAKYIDVQGNEFILKTMSLSLPAALSSLTALIPAISLFLYRKRILQMRLNIYNSILLATLQGFVIYYMVSGVEQDMKFVFAIQSVFPVVSLVLSILAIRGILKDELLVRSLNRIR
jgi:lysylphosphatidylglycerol synthetase-like protein (DUF2156 family)